MTAKPVVTIAPAGAVPVSAGLAVVLIGQEQTLRLTFDNQPDALSGSNTGYMPYVDVLLPRNGADGAGVGTVPANDGLSFVSATYLDAPLSAQVLEFDAAGRITHPFARQADGTPLVVTGVPGDALVVLRLPFGSFTDNQTPAEIALRVRVASEADLGVPLTVGATGGFAYGSDPLNNPAADAPLRGTQATLGLDPQVAAIDVVYAGPEQETATGPSYPRSWQVQGLIADGQSLTDFTLSDTLPDGLVLLGASIVNGIGTVRVSADGRQVTARFDGTVTGGGAPPTLKIDYVVGQTLSDGTPVLDPVTGAFRAMRDEAQLSGTWKPTDARDPVTLVVLDPAGPEDVITAKSIAVQKYVSVVDAAEPGGHLQWRLEGQVSNYFEVDQLLLTDTLGDGQVFDSAFQPVLTVREGGRTVYSGALTQFSVVRDPATGLSTVKFDISAELRARGLDDGLQGGGAGSPNPATATVSFRSVIERNWTGPVPADRLVDQGDLLNNAVVFSGQVAATDRPIADGSGAEVALPASSVAKSIYAINGTVSPAGSQVVAGDEITFRLKLDLPLTSAHQVKLTDFLPLPVLLAADADANPATAASFTFVDRVSGAAPAVGQASFGPADSFHSSGDRSVVPAVRWDAASNSLTFDFGDVDAGTYDASTIDLLFTVRVADAAFGDGLLLTNQVTASEANSRGAVSEDNAIVQFTLTEPELSIRKSVVATSNARAVIADADGGAWSPAGIAWTAPGSLIGNRFTGTLNSNALASESLDANVTGLDAGDLVSFALVVENTGSGVNGAFDLLLRDVLPAGLAVPLTGLNLRVTDGTGRQLGYTLEGGGLFATNGGLRLTDPALRDGAVDAADATSGRNVVVVTYDLLLGTNPNGTAVQPGSLYAGNASIVNYAAREGGTNRVPSSPAADMVDGATIATAGPSITKAVVTTSATHTTAARGDAAITDLAIGETVTFGLTIRLSEGLNRDLRIQDLLPNTNGDLEVVSARIVSSGLNLVGVNTLATPTLTDRDADGVRDSVTFALGDVLNIANNIEDAGDLITVEVVARARNQASNTAGDLLVNTATVSVADGDEAGMTLTASATASVELVEPSLSISKSVNRATADAGDLVTYTVKVANGNGTYSAAALDLALTDLLAGLPPSAAFRPGTVTVAGTTAAATVVTGNGAGDTGLRVDLARLDPGETLTVTFQAAVDGHAAAGTTVNGGNATVVGTSLMGGDAAERSYTASAGATFAVPRPTTVKSVFATDAADTGTARYTSLTDLKIGETATFEITVTLPEGDSPGFRITDLLPDTLVAGTGGRLAYVDGSASVVSVGGNINARAGGPVAAPVVTTSDSNGNGTADRVVLSFGDLTNAADNQVTAGDRMTVRLQARLVDAVANENGDTLTNTAFAEANGLAGGNATARVEVVEPRLSIDKSSTVVAGAPLDAGAEITYTLTVRHASTSQLNAYDLLVQDALPPGLELVAGSLSSSAGAVTAAGGTIAAELGQLALGGAPLTITYRARVTDAVAPGQSLSNTASVTYDNLDGAGGRAGPAAQDTEARTVALSPTITKTVAATGDANTGTDAFTALPDLAIGETVTFRLLATLGEGTQRVVLSDTLPAGMTLLGTALESVGANIKGLALPAASTTGQVTRLDFGTVTNLGDNLRDAGDQFAVLVTARVSGPSLAAGTVLTNTAQIETSGASGAGLASASASASAEVVRPLLLVDKSTPVTTGDGADIVTYSITLRHAADSTGPAYNLQLDDALAPGLSLVAGSATTTAGSLSSSGGVLRLTLDSLANGAAPVVVTYQARLADGVVNGQAITNSAALRYDTAPASGTGLTASDPATVTVSLANTVDKVLVGTDNATTAGSDVAPGELVTWRIAATLAEGLQTISLADLLPTGLDYVASRVISLGALGGSALPVGASGSWNAAARSVGFNFGTLLNAGDNAVTAGDTLVVEVQARVTTAPANGALLTNAATLTASTPANTFGVAPGTVYGTVSDTDAVRDVEARLGGNVFLDNNGNGLQDAGEGGVSGVSVRLLDATGSETGRSATTGADGQYLFSDLAPGSYSVAFVRPAAQQFTLADVGANNAADSDADRTTGRTASITLVAGADDRSLDAGLYVPASIGDRVFHDLNANGVQDAGEGGIGGIALRLLDATGATIATTVSDSSGGYQFGGLIPGSYRVAAEAAGWLVSPPDRGGSEAGDSDLDPATRISSSFVLGSGTQETRLDLGLWRTASLGDRVFLDRNGNGVQDADDTGIAGVRVTLLDAAGVATGQSATTDAGGNYLFSGLAPGGYRVRFETPIEARVSPRDVGGDAADSDIDASATTGVITLASDQVARDAADAGFWYNTRLGDRVWEDLNGNGVQDAGEPGLAGVTVRLLDTSGREAARTTTATDGSYLFSGHPGGTYSLQFAAPAGYVATRADQGGNDAADSDIRADGGTAPFSNIGLDTSRDAGFYRPVTVGGSAWLDVDGNGVRGGDEPGLPGVPVRLLDPSGTPLGPVTATNAAGLYSFEGLAPGSYRVGFAPLVGTAFTVADRGGSEALDSDASPVTGVSGLTVTLASGGSSTLSTAGLVLDLTGGFRGKPILVLDDLNNGFPGTASGEVVYGRGGDDSLNGLGGDDLLFGEGGNDSLNGHEGNDTLSGGDGNDNVQGQAGDDLILGGAGDDIGEGGDGNDVLIAGAGNDNMQGEGNDDQLYGGSGDDILTGNQGNDVVAGGSGNDRLTGADGSDIVIGGRDGGTMKLDGQGRLTGIVTGDTLEGNGGADAFVWQAGDGVDLIFDFNPAEGDTLTIYGYERFTAIQRTDDGRMALYLGQDAGFVLNNGMFQGASPNNALAGVRFITSTDGAPGNVVGTDVVVPVLAQNWVSTFRGTGAVTVARPFQAIYTVSTTPSEGDDNLTGTADADRISGLGGDDVLLGLGGNDILDGGAGNDRLAGGDGNDRLIGGAGTDTVQIDFAAYNWRIVRRGDEVFLRNIATREADDAQGVEAVAFLDGTVIDTTAMPSTSPLEYVASYGDLINTFGTNGQAAWAHLFSNGILEGRSVQFDGLAYIASHTDLIRAFGANEDLGARHFIEAGRFEGRGTTFDPAAYLASYEDLLAVFGKDTEASTAHYIQSGFNEGRQITFDGLAYIASYEDLMGVFGADAAAGSRHYILNGRNEGRETTFDAGQYLRNYRDLQAAFGTDEEAATAHYIRLGHLEGRTDELLG